MILIDRHTQSREGPFHATLRIKPAARIQLTDVRGELLDEFGDEFTKYTRFVLHLEPHHRRIP